MIEIEEILKENMLEFSRKYQNYGISWKAFRPSGMTDQIYIKLKRIIELDSGTKSLVEDESIEDTLRAIYNYCIIRYLMVIESEDYIYEYKKVQEHIYNIMLKKNTDYGSVWKEIRLSSIYDLMMAKLFRIIEMENNKTFYNYEEFYDIANYSIFAIIRNREKC